MYRNKIPKKPTTLRRNTGYEGETIEQKIHRIVNNKEPIKDSAPIVYTERKNGVEAQYNIRTDRFEIAVETMDNGAKGHQARRQESIGARAKEGMKKEEGTETKNNGGTEPIQGTK